MIKDPESLARQELESVVRAIQNILWFDGDTLEPDKAWSPDTLDEIAGVLHRAGLAPEATE